MRFCIATLPLLLTAGCISLDFTNRSDIEYTRAIAIEVDPPVFRPGNEVRARALVVRPDGTHVVPDGFAQTGSTGLRECNGTVCFDWALCLRAERVPGLSGAQFSPEVPSQGCDNAALAGGTGESEFVEVLPDGSIRLDTGPLADLVDVNALTALAQALGIPASAAEDVLTRTGIPLLLELRVFDGEDVFIAYKRGLFIDDGCTENCSGVNPPAPEFAFFDPQEPANTQRTSGRNSDTPFECEPCEQEDVGEPCLTVNRTLSFRPGRSYIVAPKEDGETWLERYTVLSLAGEFLETTEQGYFSWFTTGGALQQERTRFPAAEEIFTAPEEPGDYALWLVVRDGHYGARACRARFTVSEDEGSDP